jgi:hypothetical protein
MYTQGRKGVTHEDVQAKVHPWEHLMSQRQSL